MEIAAPAVSLSQSLMERPDELTWSRGVTRRSTRELRSATRHCAAKTRFVERLRFCEPITPLPNYSITQSTYLYPIHLFDRDSRSKHHQCCPRAAGQHERGRA